MAPAAPPPPPAEAVASNERSADKESAPMAKKAKADDSARTSPLELARMARKVHQWREAARRYEEFIDRFPNHAELPAALFETAETYERLGETARAIELYRLVARNGGGLGDRAQDRISELEGKRRKQAAPAKPSPQAAPAKDFEAEAPNAAERK
jgi:TolA-binding protein